MNSLKPANLTEPQWLLLQCLSQYATPFYSDFVYVNLYSPDINKLEVYRMFIRLAVLGYIQLDSFGELIPGRKQEVLYTLAQKGKETVANYTQPTLLDDFIASLSIEQNERSIASISATTIRLKNFLLYL